MAMEPEANPGALERLSALADGELIAPDAALLVCGSWRESESLRASWHAYHLIGDVLRSDDLACDVGRDTAFMVAFRARMADEPVVLAPQSDAAQTEFERSVSVASGRGWRAWRLPSALAAGVIAAVGATLVARAPVGADAAAPLALLSPPAVPAAPVVDPQPTVADGQLIRDVRLDRYLAAHKQFAGSTALGIPSGFLRNATAVESDR